MKEHCAIEGMSLGAFIGTLVEDYMNKEARKSASAVGPKMSAYYAALDAGLKGSEVL